MKIGFKREEFALAPVTMKAISDGDYKYQVDMPSFFAAIDVNSDFTSIFNSLIGYRQIVATGSAADNVAVDPGVQELVKNRFGLNSTSLCLSKWLNNSASNIPKLNNWLSSHSISSIDDLVNNQQNWQTFAKSNKDTLGVCD